MPSTAKKIKFWGAIILVILGAYLTMEGIKYLGLRPHQQEYNLQNTSS